ncbi:MAG: ABC transporter substrate-binding protein [Chloroflexi bacterium]|nr:ABC transporter substrate-binding protein [Chloroflexota bacterium]
MKIPWLNSIGGCFAAVALLAASCAAAAPAPSPTAAGAATVVPKSATGAPVPASTPKPAADQPKYGGIVSRSTDQDVPHFDLHQGQTAAFSLTLFNVYQGLVRLDPIGHEKIMPELAQAWEVSPDGRSYSFKLSKDVKWHDGKPLTMEDVKYSLDRMQKPKEFKTIAGRGQALLAAMDSVEIAGDDTIKIATRYPSASFLTNLASGWIVIAPKHILSAKGDMKTDLVGTGPFKLKSFNANVSFELQKNDAYYVRGVPYLDGITFYTIKDVATRFGAFRTGKVKMTWSASPGLTPPQAETVRREMADRATVYEHDAMTRYNILFNTRKKPWDDARVRKAIELAFDRQAAIKVNGAGNVGSLFGASWGMKPQVIANLPGYRQPKDADMVEAKKLMADAGFPGGLKTTLTFRSGGPNQRQGEVAKDQLAKVGIDADLIVVEQAVLNERLDRRAFDLASHRLTDTTGDPDEILYTYYATGAVRNYGDFSDKDVDALIDKQARTLDKAGREAVLQDVEQRLMNAVPMVIVFWDVSLTGALKEVRNFSPGPGIHPWGKLDYVWLAN